MANVVIRKPVTWLLLIVVSIAIVAVTLLTAGHSYSKMDPVPFEEIRTLAERLETRPISTNIIAIIVVPIIGNVLLFVPWGFFLFIALYSVERPTVQTYVLTTLLGLSFTMAIEAWQYFLPSRVADINDIIWNTLGAVLGGILGHMRLRVRVEFE